jgi:hypothetical protein
MRKARRYPAGPQSGKPCATRPHVTPQQVHDCFAQAISRRRKPSVEECAPLAAEINRVVDMVNFYHSFVRSDDSFFPACFMELKTSPSSS